MTAHAQEDARTKLILQINFFWRIAFALLAVAGTALLWTGSLPQTSLLVKSLLTLALLSAAVFSVIGAVQISRRNHLRRSQQSLYQVIRTETRRGRQNCLPLY